MPRILLHWDAMGAFHFAAEEGIEVVCISETATEDRLYITQGGHPPELIDAVIAGEDPIDAADRIYGK